MVQRGQIFDVPFTMGLFLYDGKILLLRRIDKTTE